MNREEITAARSQFVVMGNELIQKSRYKLTLTQQRILLLMVSKIKPTDKPHTEYNFTYQEFINVCNIKKGGKTTEIVSDALIKLRTQPIVIYLDKNRKVVTGWFNDAIINSMAETVKITFSPYLAPYLYNLKELYTQTCLECSLPMKTTYGIRLYEYLSSIKHMKVIKPISIEEFKQRTGCEGKYELFKDLRVRVLEPAIFDINTYSDIKVSYTVVKKSRKVVGIDFKIEDCDDMVRRLNRKAELG